MSSWTGAHARRIRNDMHVEQCIRKWDQDTDICKIIELIDPSQEYHI